MVLAGACVLTWSRNRAARATSSCEAELFPLVNAATECVWSSQSDTY